MAFYVPVVQTEYVLEGLFSEEQHAKLMGTGCVDTDTLARAFPSNKPGDKITIPQYVQVPAAAHADITITDGTNSGLTFTGVSTNDSIGIICRDVVPYSWTESDRRRTGEDFGRLAAMTVGNRIAQRMIKQTVNVLDVATQVTSGTDNNHTLDATTGTYATASGSITVGSIRRAKLLAGDQGNKLTTAIMHSSVWGDLLDDLIVNYKYNAATISAIMNGELEAVMGIRNIVVTDNITQKTTGIGSGAYGTYLCGPGCCYHAYQQAPIAERWDDIRTPTTQHLEKVTFDYAIGVRGSAYDGATMNPTDAQLVTDTNWSPTTEDHRNLRAVRILSWGGVAV